MPATRSELVIAAVHYLYALSHHLPPAAASTTVMGADAAEALAEILFEQGRSRAEQTQVFSLIAATQAELQSGRAQPFAKDAYDAARARAVRGLAHAGQAGHQIWPPTSQTVRKRLGTNFWNDALRSLGFPTSGGGRKRGAFHYSPEDFLRSIADFLADARAAGTPESFSRYGEWVITERSAGRMRPSGASVRNRFGSWNAAKAAADRS